MPTAEDVIVTKLHWALLANRSKDRDDVRGVIAVQADRIDWDYVHRWCEQHGTRACWMRSVPRSRQSEPGQCTIRRTQVATAWSA